MGGIVSSNTLGLAYSSNQLLPSHNVFGTTSIGRNGQNLAVNVATGNLVVSAVDQWMMALGPDARALRTYNSDAQFNDGDNSDQWMFSFSRRLEAISTTNINRIGEDGSVTVFTWDATKNLFLSHASPDAFETIQQIGADWVWKSSDRQLEESYNQASGTTKAKLVSYKDRSGNTTTLTYVAQGAISVVASVQSTVGNRIAFTYDASNSGRVSKVEVFAQGATTAQFGTTYEFDSAGRLWKSKVQTSSTVIYETVYTYVGTTKYLNTLTTSDGLKVTVGYDTSNRVTSIKEALSATVEKTQTFAYGTNVTTVTDGVGAQVRLTYDAQKRITAVTHTVDSKVLSWAYTYDTLSGNLASVTDESAAKTTFKYDANGNRVFEQDQVGNTITRVFSADNQLQVTRRYVGLDSTPHGATNNATGELIEHRFYDANLRLIYSLGADGELSEFTYDTSGRLTQTLVFTKTKFAITAGDVYATIQSKIAPWASAQNKELATRTDFTYDTAGQLSQSTIYSKLLSTGAPSTAVSAVATNVVMQYVYNPRGQLVETLDNSYGPKSIVSFC
jgi:YD repeat-containing protein